ncbi:hypothetical protein [Variovorax sp. Root411]|uniref:hypothetical protein n=1 Tax=Variovorax sp. Root411 TaxID=1736530 RepID=UPI000A6411B5|nr:hypothetical protein [Variovorax sp. Root411]
MVCFLPHRGGCSAANLQAYLFQGDLIMKSIILWLCGVPLIVIIGLKIFGVF